MQAVKAIPLLTFAKAVTPEGGPIDDACKVHFLYGKCTWRASSHPIISSVNNCSVFHILLMTHVV